MTGIGQIRSVRVNVRTPTTTVRAESPSVMRVRRETHRVAMATTWKIAIERTQRHNTPGK